MSFPEVALPIGLLLSPLKTRIEKILLLDTYLKSHREYSKRDGFLIRWQNITSNLQVSLSLPSVLDNERVPMARIAIRGTGFERIDRIQLLVESESVLGTYQDIVIFYNVGEKPIITSLPSIPLRSYYISDDLKLIDSMSTFRIYMLQLGDTHHSITIQNSCAVISHPNTIDLLNDRFEERWGAYWNMAAIDFAIQAKAHYLNYLLFPPKVLSGSALKTSYPRRFKTALRAIVLRPIHWLLTRPFLLKAYFWVPILIFRRKWDVESSF